MNIDEALKADGSVVTWGDGNYGGDAREAYPALTGWSLDRLVSAWRSHLSWNAQVDLTDTSEQILAALNRSEYLPVNLAMAGIAFMFQNKVSLRCQALPSLQSGVKLLAATYGAFSAATWMECMYSIEIRNLLDSRGLSCSFCFPLIAGDPWATWLVTHLTR